MFMLSSNSLTKDADQIVGNWLTEKKNSKVRIFESGGKYYGKISWVEESIDPQTGEPYLDILNPDKSKRDTPVFNLLVMKDFIYNNANQTWENGTVYNAMTGKTYSGYMKLSTSNKLKLRGYIGIPIFGRTDLWTRLKE